jgi:hypothetical protein
MAWACRTRTAGARRNPGQADETFSAACTAAGLVKFSRLRLDRVDVEILELDAADLQAN